MNHTQDGAAGDHASLPLPTPTSVYDIYYKANQIAYYLLLMLAGFKEILHGAGYHIFGVRTN